MFKKIISSKIFRFGLSAILIYFAFRTVDVGKLINELSKVPLWFVLFMLAYYTVTMFINSARWCLLIIDKPKLKDFILFTKATYLGGFYSLFFPTMAAGDLMKWVPLMKHYPHLSKTKMLGSALLDRVIGLSAFIPMGTMALVVGKYLNYEFPEILLWVFVGMTAGVIIFYAMVFTMDFDKYFGKYKFLNRLLEIVSLLQKENKYKVIICLLIAAAVEPVWVAPYWFFSLIFGAGVSILQIFIFVPVIALILVLPISIAGFGARENLFLYFLVPLGYAPEKILLISTFAGIMAIIINLIGGIFLLWPDEVDKKELSR